MLSVKSLDSIHKKVIYQFLIGGTFTKTIISCSFNKFTHNHIKQNNFERLSFVLSKSNSNKNNLQNDNTVICNISIYQVLQARWAKRISRLCEEIRKKYLPRKMLNKTNLAVKWCYPLHYSTFGFAENYIKFLMLSGTPCV